MGTNVLLWIGTKGPFYFRLKFTIFLCSRNVFPSGGVREGEKKTGTAAGRKMWRTESSTGRRERERLLSYPEVPRFFRDSVEFRRDDCCSSCYSKILELWKNLGRVVAEAMEMGKSDPRKIMFSAKMGLALVLVSLLFLLKVPLKDLGRYSFWAILIVVVVFEFSIGNYEFFILCFILLFLEFSFLFFISVLCVLAFS